MSETAKVLGDLFIKPLFDDSKIEVTFTAPAGASAAKWEIHDQKGPILHGSLGLKEETLAKFQAAIDDFKPWNVDSPYLYSLHLTLTVDGEEVEVIQPFGMRKIHVEGDQIFVNNEKFYMRAYIRGREAHDHPNLEGMALEDWYAKNFEAAKAYGFNFVRFHSRIPPVECFRAADRLGIFMHVEIRRYYGKYQKERVAMEAGELVVEEEWRQAMHDTRNHPSLMVWCLGNEIRHPGNDPRVSHLAAVTKELDPTRLFLDTCAHGEFDRDYVDIDVQHMSYYYPFGQNYDMYENTYNWFIYGSSKGVPLVEQDAKDDFNYRITRAIQAGRRPVMAHEICHYVAYRDLDALERKFIKAGAEKPWWIDELRKLVDLKGLGADYPKMIEASRHFQFLGWKLGIEAARRSSILCGFHFLQLSDTERYENSNGVVDCFDDSKGVDEGEFLKFNGDTVLLADLPRRTYFENEKVGVPILVSHFSPTIAGMADFSFQLTEASGKVVTDGKLESIDLTERGRREICQLELKLPQADQAKALKLTVRLDARDGSWSIDNNWDLWVFADRPAEVSATDCTVALDEIKLDLRYPRIESTGSLKEPAKLLIVNRFGPEVLGHLENGGDVLMMYRVPETRDRKFYPDKAPREKYYLPASWDRFKGVIWDRGTNCGAFMRPSKALESFPHEGLMDFQFAGLVNDADKICLDDFPVKVQPIMQGVDKATRDRFDVFTFELSEFQPEWTMRKFAYLFELKVGKGRLLVSGFNFTGLNSHQPEACAMFESLLGYVKSDAFKPETEISAKELEEYLLAKGKAPRIKERKMTQYWQLNAEPLESDRYWKESEEYIRRQD
jgi:hypothetical protein